LIPVTVVGGYLGAGKTTLVNHLLRHADGLQLGVLVNDFGELPIDASLIEGEEDGVLSLAGGCVCCAIGSDLLAALERIATRAPRHLLLETSGVALPGPVAATIRLLPGFAPDAVLVLADAETVRAQAADRYMGDTILRQLAQADLVLLNKADLAAPAQRGATRDWLAAVAPRARVLETTRGDLPLAVALGAGPGRGGGGAFRLAGDAAQRYESLALRPQHPVDVPALARALAQPALGVLRAKGVLRDLTGEAMLVQNVGARHEAGATHLAPTGLVCIGFKGRLDGDAIRRLAGS